MKPKLILINGIFGTDKTAIASILASKLKTEIIAGEHMQLYSNFPISTFSSSPAALGSVKYNLLGHTNIFKNRIIASQYKELMINEINRLHNENKVPIIEGGSGFYLSYLLTSGTEHYPAEKLDDAGQKAKDLVKKISNWDKLTDKLKEICPQYDNSIAYNDFYRLENALKYAIASEGALFKMQHNPQDKLTELFDVRGFFITMTQEMSIIAAKNRCYQAILSGIVEEFVEFVKENKNSPLNLEEVSTPMGFPLLADFVNDLIYLEGNKYLSGAENLKKLNNMCTKFMGHYQTDMRRRKYMGYQRQFFRNKFNYFMWKETRNTMRQTPVLADEIYMEILLSEEEFKEKVNSEKNQGLIAQKLDPKKGRLPPQFELSQDNLVVKYMVGKVIPKLRDLEKITIYEKKGK